MTDVHNISERLIGLVSRGESCFRRWEGVEERDASVDLGEIGFDVPWLVEDRIPTFLLRRKQRNYHVAR